jgi:PAS domain S-box-containing protein
LFLQEPKARTLFPDDINTQRQKFVEMVSQAVDNLDNLDAVLESLDELGQRHVEYGVHPSMFESAGKALLMALEHNLGDQWSVDVADAWEKLYGFLARCMVKAMKAKRKSEHHARASDQVGAAANPFAPPPGIDFAAPGAMQSAGGRRAPLPRLGGGGDDSKSVESGGSLSSGASTTFARMIQTLDGLTPHFQVDRFTELDDKLSDATDEELLHKTAAAMILADRLMVLSEYPTIVISTDGTIVLVSPSIEELLGFAAEEIAGRNIGVLMSPNISHKHDMFLANYVASCQRRERRISSVVNQTRPIVAQHQNGSPVPVFLSVREVKGDRKAATPYLFVGQLRGAATEVNLRQALVEAKLLENVFPFPYFETDERGLITRFNPAAEESFGLNTKLVCGKNVVILMPDHITLVGSGRRERRSSHHRLMENYVQKIRDVGRESVTSYVVDKKTRHRAVRLNTKDYDSVRQEEFDIELEVSLAIGMSGEFKFRAFVRVQENFMNAEEFQDKLIEQMFPAPIAERYSKGINVNGTQDVSCLFCDIVGFTSLAAMMEDQMTVEILNDLWTRFSAIQSQLPSFQPIKTNYDEMMVVMGMYAEGNHADDAVLGAFLMLEALAEHNQEYSNSIQIRIGISSGSAILAVMETAKLSFDVIGETTVLASRAEGTGKPNHVHVTESTYLRLSPRIKEKFELRPEPTYFKNIGEMSTYLSVTTDVRELLN